MLSLVQTLAAGTFPRNITVGPDGHFLYLTNYTSRTIQLIALKGLHNKKDQR